MQSVKIEVAKLLPIIRKNKDSHREMFLKAQEGFRKRVVQRLDEMLKDARDGKRYALFVELQAPIDQTKEYNTVIDMLDMTSDMIIQLSRQEFNQYVRDEWSWSAATFAVNSSYTG